MQDPRLGLRQRLVDAVLDTAGASDPALRRAVQARAAQLGGSAVAGAADVAADLSRYIDKVAMHAYKTTDEDVAALLHAGYSEDAVFEITVSAALGAGMARLERGLAALERAG